MTISRVTRRTTLAASVGLAAAAAPLAQADDRRPGRSAAPARPRQRFVDASGSYRLKVGDFACLVVSDGRLRFPAQVYAANATPAQYEPLLRANFLPTDVVANQTSGLVVDTGKQVLLAETGITQRWRALTGAPPGSLDDTGTLIPNLRRAGLALSDVDAVFVSHGHPDHLGALLDNRGRLMFPKARIFYDRRDYDYHAAPPSTQTPEQRAETEVARRILNAVRPKLELTRPGDVIADGVSIFDAAGHTPGHCGLIIESNGERLMHGADLVAHYVLSLAHPEWSFYATIDKPAEIAARRAFFAEWADKRERVFFCHVPFPNIGHIVRDGNGFRWLPEYYASADEGHSGG